ncbi:MAG: ABC transporter permease [Alphaproteobacteria bacterium]|nr:ABC transporter permease [Alphaproteobacteria bacterium]
MNLTEKIYTPTARESLTEGLKIQARVVWALILREMQTKHGRKDIGYLWAMFEPIMLMGIFFALFAYRGMTEHAGMPLVPFLLTGILPVVTMRKIANGISTAELFAKPLLIYRQVTVLDAMIARVILEGATFFVVFAFLVFVACATGYSQPPHDLLAVVISLFMIIFFGMSAGFFQNVLTTFWPVFNRIMSHIWRLLLFVSCVFYTLRDVPAQVRDVLYYNPLVHLIELFREGFFVSFETSIPGYGYVAIMAVVSLFIGLLSERMIRFRAFD